MSNIRPVLMEDSELVQIVRDKYLVPGQDYLVIDVRDDDFQGGNIPNAINLPSYIISNYSNHGILLENIRKYKHVKKVVFHCALSKQRGPKCARLWCEGLEMVAESEKEGKEGKEKELEGEKDGVSKRGQEIYVLKGGFGLWQSKYKDEDDLIENYDKEMWEYEW
ncbi:Rhodanese-like domain-containing protein [Paraphysoderma sedebokerense]|nr:Rhodanese-like domain-containing protein [Paraphysoderma sedebokerense]